MPGGERTIIAQERASVGDHQFHFYLGKTGRLGFAVTDAGGHEIWPFESTEPPPAESWTHVAVSREQRRYVLYLGGKAVARKDAPVLIDHESDLDLLIGARHGGGEGLAAVFDGLIDDVKIYNRPLTPEEIVSLAEAAARRKR